jgi:hypothetical protein
MAATQYGPALIAGTVSYLRVRLLLGLCGQPRLGSPGWAAPAGLPR